MLNPHLSAGHHPSCRQRFAAECPIPVECPHGFDVCPTCDPCTCNGVTPYDGGSMFNNDRRASADLDRHLTRSDEPMDNAKRGTLVADYVLHYEHNAQSCDGDIEVTAGLMESTRHVTFFGVRLRCSKCGPVRVTGHDG